MFLILEIILTSPDNLINHVCQNFCWLVCSLVNHACTQLARFPNYTPIKSGREPNRELNNHNCTPGNLYIRHQCNFYRTPSGEDAMENVVSEKLLNVNRELRKGLFWLESALLSDSRICAFMWLCLFGATGSLVHVS